MRKTRVLVATGFGVWLGWRARESLSSLASFGGVGRSDRSRRPAHLVEDALSPGEAVEKARAIFELGRERGHDLLRQVLGRSHAA